jgi:hypothetical protein
MIDLSRLIDFRPGRLAQAAVSTTLEIPNTDLYDLPTTTNNWVKNR